MKCPNCNSENKDSNLFCDGCGAYIGEQPTDELGEIAADTKKRAKKQKYKKTAGEKKKLSKRGIIILCAVVAAVIAIAAGVIFALTADKEDSSPLVYLKENSLMALTEDSATPFALTETVSEKGNSPENQNYKFYIKKNEDGTKILYSDSITAEGPYEVYKLYLRDVENPVSAIASADSAKGLFIASGVYGEVQTTSDFKKVAYLRNPDANGGKLMVFNMKEEIPIDTDVVKFFFAENGKKLVYLKTTGSSLSLYECKAKSGAEPKLVDNNINEIYPMDLNSLSLYAVLRTDATSGQKSLMSVKKGKTPVLINAAVKDVYTSEQGSEYLYYTCEEKTALNWSDFVEDDLAATDAAVKKPVREDYPSDAAFSAVLKSYEAKEKRDSLRAAIKTAVAECTATSLNVYHKGNSVRLTANLGTLEAIEGDTAFYTSYNNEGVKIKINELAAAGESLPTGEKAEKMLAGKASMYIANNGNSKLLIEDARLAKLVKADGDKIYVAENCAADFKSGDVSVITLKDGKTTRIDSVVSLDNMCFTQDGRVYYIKNIKNGSGTLCGFKGKKSEEIAKNVGAVYPAGNSSVFYFTDWNSTNSATLGFCEKFGERHIDTDVLKEGVAYRDGCVFYIKGYSDEKGGGNLYRSYSKRDVALIGEYVRSVY